MNSNYIKGWGIHVGNFNERQLMNNEDLEEVEKYQKVYEKLKYVNTKEIKENGERKLAIYICSVHDVRLNF